MLTPAEPPTLRELFLAVARVTEHKAQQSYLDQACPDPVLRKRVERLLKAKQEQSSSLLDQAVAESERWHPGEDLTGHSTHIDPEKPSSASEITSAEPMPDTGSAGVIASRIGPYKIIEQLGQGGMGVVYLAEQTCPVRRQVALKIIKPGMDSQEIIARFEAERQALAVMDHPYIARVLDAGQTLLGHPYFVMELVRGTPITEYCSDVGLKLHERLELFIKVCQGVQHAHQKGIVHRDLKPQNVLVAEYDGAPAPKVIDFGVAKALDQQLTEPTIHTHIQQLIGTPSYMSPEQTELGGLDVDTRTDIYSLGGLLYELVTGTPPFDKALLNSQSFDEMRRIIREDQPQPPSRRLATTAKLPTSHQKHAAFPASLSLLQSRNRELDWIVLKALEKDRGRRYESAGALLQDVQRFIKNEPVEASPPSVMYRLRKFARRNKAWLTAALLMMSMLVIATIVSTSLAFRATEAEDQAHQANESLRELLYASDTVLAAQDILNNDAQQARSRLTRHIPERNQSDLRGFEWYYLWKQQDLTGDLIVDTGSAVYDLAISATGDRLVAVGEDAIVRVFDLDSHEQLYAFPTDQGEINGSAFSPDGQRLATAGDDGTVRIWNLTDQQQLIRIDAYDGLAFGVVFSPDGRSIVSCGEDPEVRVWNTADGASLGTLNVHTEKIETMAITSSGVVAAGGDLSQVSLWDLSSSQPLWERLETRQIQDTVNGLVFSDKENYLAYGTVNGQLTIAETDRQTITFRRRLADGVQSLDFAPRGNWLVVGDRAGHLMTIPFEDGLWHTQETRQWNGHDGRVYSVRVTADGRRVLSAGADGRVISWDLSKNEQRQRIHFDKQCNNLDRIDNRRFAVGATGGIYVCNDDGHIEMDLGDQAGDWYVDYAEQASLLFAKSVTEIVAWNLDDQSQPFQWISDAERDIQGFAVTPDGLTVILRLHTSSGDREVCILDVSAETIVSRWPASSANRMAISSDGRWLVYDSNNDIRLIDLKRRAIHSTWPAHNSAIRNLRFSADSNSVVSVSEDRTLKVWSVPDGNLISSALAHRTGTNRLAMTSDGRRVVTCGDDHMLRFWDGKTLQLVWEHPLQFGQVWALEFMSDDQKLICLCEDREIVIFDGSRDDGKTH
ncbi:MAG: protein kinase [Planctomycetaceae bacterium]|nr:protein kinase [Planctomycetaceae bacterium]